MRKLVGIILMLVLLVSGAVVLAVDNCPDGTGSGEAISCNSDDDGFSAGGGDDTVTIGEDAYIEDSVDGGQGSDYIENNGDFDTEADAIYDDYGDNTVVNNGYIYSDDNDGIDMDTDYGDQNVLINNGYIDAGDDGIDGGVDSDLIENHGIVYAYGSVGLDAQQGDDVIVNTGIIVTGYDEGINGGAGDDTIVNLGAVYIGDDCNPDYDDCTEIAIQASTGDDVVIVGTDSFVGGIIDGGEGADGCVDKCADITDADSDYDVLFFSLIGTDEDELNAAGAALAALLAAEDPDGGTLSYNGNFYEWQNFEDLQVLLLLLIQEEAAKQAADNSGGGSQSAQCDAYNVKIFRHDDGTFEVYGGFDMSENGYLIAMFSLRDLVSGSRFQNPNDPGLYVEVYILDDGQVQINVYDANGNLLSDSCRFSI